jgi:hypothetical protein
MNGLTIVPDFENRLTLPIDVQILVANSDQQVAVTKNVSPPGVIPWICLSKRFAMKPS